MQVLIVLACHVFSPFKTINTQTRKKRGAKTASVYPEKRQRDKYIIVILTILSQSGDLNLKILRINLYAVVVPFSHIQSLPSQENPT